MTGRKTATEAQARMLATLFSGKTIELSCNLSAHTSTAMSIKRKGWVSPNGRSGKWPSGLLYDEYEINAAGMGALENFLRAERMRAADGN